MSNIRSITRIEPGQLALMMGAGYAILGVIIGLLLFAVAAAVPKSTPFAGMTGGVAVIAMPIIYGIIGYIGGLITALVYNFVAGTVGGIKVTVSD